LLNANAVRTVLPAVGNAAAPTVLTHLSETALTLITYREYCTMHIVRWFYTHTRL